MKTLINMVLLFVHIVSLILSILFGAFGIYEQIMGPAAAEKLLEKLHIPLSYNGALIVGLVCCFIMCVTYVLRNKLSGK